jgi:hypothetical protein
MHAIDSFAITALQLGDHEVNRSFTRAALPHVTEVIEADASHDLVRTGEESGYYLLYNKVSELVDAVVHYQARSVEWFESSVTQCCCGAARRAPYPAASRATTSSAWCCPAMPPW